MRKSNRLGINWGLKKRYSISEEQESAATQGVPPTQGYAPIPTRIPADPAIHASDPPPQGGDVGEAPDPLVPPKPPTSTSQRLEHTGVGRPSEPNTQQKRRSSNRASPSDGAEAHKAQKKAQEEDNKEYFKTHKASPLSELEFVDSRKPITQATDSPTSYYGRDEGVIVWKPEQLDTAEDSLLRAVKIWKWNKMRGDPDSPHGRVLRELRGEYW
ncbi:unnamed protein product [Amaranthus hypochondriacus]